MHFLPVSLPWLALNFSPSVSSSDKGFTTDDEGSSNGDEGSSVDEEGSSVDNVDGTSEDPLYLPTDKSQIQHHLGWKFWPDELIGGGAQLNQQNELWEIITMSVFVDLLRRLVREMRLTDFNGLEKEQLFGSRKQMLGEILNDAENFALLMAFLESAREMLAAAGKDYDTAGIINQTNSPPLLSAEHFFANYYRHLVTPREIFLMSTFFRPLNELPINRSFGIKHPAGRTSSFFSTSSFSLGTNQDEIQLGKYATNSVFNSWDKLSKKEATHQRTECNFFQLIHRLPLEEEFLVKRRVQLLFRNMKRLRSGFTDDGNPLVPCCGAAEVFPRNEANFMSRKSPERRCMQQ